VGRITPCAWAIRPIGLGGFLPVPICPTGDAYVLKAVIYRLKPRHPTQRLCRRCRWKAEGVRPAACQLDGFLWDLRRLGQLEGRTRQQLPAGVELRNVGRVDDDFPGSRPRRSRAPGLPSPARGCRAIPPGRLSRPCRRRGCQAARPGARSREIAEAPAPGDHAPAAELAKGKTSPSGAGDVQ
jgi:hypothetical protein